MVIHLVLQYQTKVKDQRACLMLDLSLTIGFQIFSMLLSIAFDIYILFDIFYVIGFIFIDLIVLQVYLNAFKVLNHFLKSIYFLY